MATSFTLETLKTAIQGHVEDQGSDFASYLDTLIQVGEDRILRELPLSVFDVKASVTIVAGDQATAKPTDTIAILELYYTNSGTRIVLQPRTYSYCLDYAPTTAQGTPKFFAEDYSETELYLAPAPDVTVTAEALVTKRPESLTSASSGTFLSKNVGDLLLASCLIAAERFNVAAEQVAVWQAEYDRLLASAHVDLAHIMRRTYSTLSPQPTATGRDGR